MKIIVCRYWQLQMRFTVIMEILGIVSSFIFWHGEDIGVGIIIASYWFIMLTFGQIYTIIISHRFLSHVMYENDTFTSFFWRRKLCVIKEREPIFYTKMYERISMHHYADFVLISTEPFEYRKVPMFRFFPWSPKPLLMSYDVKKMILLPYEENAAYLSKMSEWKQIFPLPKL